MRITPLALFAAAALLSLPAAATTFSENFDDDAATTSDAAEPMQAGNRMFASKVETKPAAGGFIDGRINIKKIPGIGNVLHHSLKAGRATTEATTLCALGNVAELAGVPGTDFQMSIDLLLDTALSTPCQAGNFALILLAHGKDVTALMERYQVAVQMTGPHAGRVQIIETVKGSTTALITSSGGAPLTFTDDREYRLEVAVRYARPGDRQSAVTITATASSGSEVQTAKWTDSSPRTGSFFGLRTGLAVTKSTATTDAAFEVEFDNFTLAPGSGAPAPARKYTSP